VNDAARRRRGEAMRRAVLGDDHVDRADRTRTPFNADFQDLITRYAWGEIWTRRGLSRRTRSLVTLAALVALDRPEELRLHLEAARRNGVSRGEVKELLLQMAVYCGLPAANAAFRLAAEVFEKLDAAPGRKSRARR